MNEAIFVFFPSDFPDEWKRRKQREGKKGKAKGQKGGDGIFLLPSCFAESYVAAFCMKTVDSDNDDDDDNYNHHHCISS